LRRPDAAYKVAEHLHRPIVVPSHPVSPVQGYGIYEKPVVAARRQGEFFSSLLGSGLDIGLREPAVRDQLLAPHSAENPRTTALNETMRMSNEVFASPQFQQNLASAARRAGKSPAVGVFTVVIESFVEVHGPLDETRRMAQFAGLVNHSFRFGLMLARDHPNIAVNVRDWTDKLGDEPTEQRRSFWKFW
jgi:hypothetical protein